MTASGLESVNAVRDASSHCGLLGESSPIASVIFCCAVSVLPSCRLASASIQRTAPSASPATPHAAKAAANEAARRCAKDGIQIHGGIGYTWEHDLHLCMRRAYASEYLLGSSDWHHDRLADLIFDGEG